MSLCTACPGGTEQCAHLGEAWVRRQGTVVELSWTPRDTVQQWGFDFQDEQKAQKYYVLVEKKLRGEEQVVPFIYPARKMDPTTSIHPPRGFWE